VTVQALLEFAKGPLFVATFAFMVLGLLRRLLHQFGQFRRSLRRLASPTIDVGGNVKQSLLWLLPLKHLYRNRPLLSVASFVFHVGLLIVPIFLVNHIDLWHRGLGIAWPGITPAIADTLTLLTIAGALTLLLFRLLDRAGRTLSTPTDYLVLVAVLLPFVSGYMAMHPNVNALNYDLIMLIHVLSAELVFVLLPTTKLSHAVLFFLDRFSSDVFWQMPAGAGDRVAEELYGEARRV
jgi:nitrate reductase gamma subunit